MNGKVKHTLINRNQQFVEASFNLKRTVIDKRVFYTDNKRIFEIMIDRELEFLENLTTFENIISLINEVVNKPKSNKYWNKFGILYYNKFEDIKKLNINDIINTNVEKIYLLTIKKVFVF